MIEALLLLAAAAAVGGWGAMVVADLVTVFTVPLPPAPEPWRPHRSTTTVERVRVIGVRRIWPARFWIPEDEQP